MVWPMEQENGNRFEGNYSYERRSGPGVFFFTNGARYVGNFENNNFNGSGKLYYPNGNILDSSFLNGLPDGLGILYSSVDKKYYEVVYTNGVITLYTFIGGNNSNQP